MKRMLQILGGALVLILIIAGSTVAYLFYAGPRLDASSKAYVDQTVPLIVDKWSEDALWVRAAPELKQKVTREQLKDLFEKCSRELGNLRTYDGSAGEANFGFAVNSGKVITARYLVKSTFEKGRADVAVGLIEHDGQWQLLSFYVNSPLLLK